MSVKDVSDLLRSQGKMLVTAESCTGGLIAANFTDIAGSSDIFDRGFVTYSNQAKIDHVMVQEETLKDFGAVSEDVALEMATGALGVSGAQIAVSVTGIAGPGGCSDEKPVGLVYIGVADMAHVEAFEHYFTGDRGAIREQSVLAALNHLKERLS